MLELEKLVFKRGRTRILDSMDARAQKGSFTILLGGNGTGKTTLLNCLAGMLDLDSGVICSNNSKIDPKSPEWGMRLSYTLDNGGTIPLLTIDEQLRLQCLLNGVDKKEAGNRADEIIRLLNLSEHRNHRAEELSAGLRKKLGIGLGLIRDADIYLFDEPYSSLDIEAAVNLTRLFAVLKQRGRTVILSTHMPSFVSELGDCIWQISNGKIKEYSNSLEIQQFVNNPGLSADADIEKSRSLSWIDGR